jgi:HlyD family secretion protein
MRTAPIYREQEQAWEQLAREGFAGRLLALERKRNRIKNEQDLQAQAAAVSSSKAAIDVSERRIGQLSSNYRRELNNERIEVLTQLERLQEDLAKHSHRSGQLELRAPVDGVIKDLATHTVGTVVAPGTILATLVPRDEPLEAEAWLNNLDAGRVHVGSRVRVKLAAYPFQRFGMLEGSVRHISADASERPEPGVPGAVGLYYRVLVSINSEQTPLALQAHPLVPGMQLAAEIHGGTRTVLDYLIAPIRKTASEAAREF